MIKLKSIAHTHSYFALSYEYSWLVMHFTLYKSVLILSFAGDLNSILIDSLAQK